MSKIIIHNQLEGDDTDLFALTLVRKVVEMGKESETAGVKHYCHATLYQTNKGDVAVTCRANKRGTVTFHVYMYGHFERGKQ